MHCIQSLDSLDSFYPHTFDSNQQEYFASSAKFHVIFDLSRIIECQVNCHQSFAAIGHPNKTQGVDNNLAPQEAYCHAAK